MRTSSSHALNARAIIAAKAPRFRLMCCELTGKDSILALALPGARSWAFSGPHRFPDRGGRKDVRGFRTTVSGSHRPGRERRATRRLVFVFSHMPSRGGVKRRMREDRFSLKGKSATTYRLNDPQYQSSPALTRPSFSTAPRQRFIGISATLEKPLSREFLFHPVQHLSMMPGSGFCVARELAYRESLYCLSTPETISACPSRNYFAFKELSSQKRTNTQNSCRFVRKP